MGHQGANCGSHDERMRFSFTRCLSASEYLLARGQRVPGFTRVQPGLLHKGQLLFCQSVSRLLFESHFSPVRGSFPPTQHPSLPPFLPGLVPIELTPHRPGCTPAERRLETKEGGVHIYSREEPTQNLEQGWCPLILTRGPRQHPGSRRQRLGEEREAERRRICRPKRPACLRSHSAPANRLQHPGPAGKVSRGSTSKLPAPAGQAVGANRWESECFLL